MLHSFAIIKNYLIACMLLVLLNGCASMQSLSSYARTGDTVIVALGGTEDNNALVDVLKKENISVSITDASSVTYPVTLRRIFKVFPDYTSGYMHRTHERSDTSSNYDPYVPPLEGQWMAVIDLVNPLDGTQPALAAGQATIAVSSPEQLNPTVYYGYNYSWTNGDLGSIDVEIIPGQGSLHELNYTQPVSFSPVSALEPLPQVIVTPNGTPTALIGGGDFRFRYSPSAFVKELIAVPVVHDPNVQIISSSTALNDGSGDSELHVMILNPKGFLLDNERTGLMPMLYGEPVMGIGQSSPFKSLRFSLVWDFKNDGTTDVSDANWQAEIQLVSGVYLDLNGDQMMELTPVLNKAR